MVAWLKALLFVGGGLVAAGGTAYFTGLLDPLVGRTPPIVASLPPAVEAPTTPPASPPAAEAVPEPEDPVTTEKQSRLSAPTFDLVRVETDGSMLVAGNAPSRAQVEVLAGDSVLGSVAAGGEGDFVVVLDEPLKPGDYQIQLRAKIGDEVVMSVQTATVSIPEAPDGQVLAMVEEPGEPSRIITAPQPPAAAAAEPATTEPATAEPEVAATEPPAAAEEEIAAAPEAAQPGAAQAPEAAGDEVAAAEEPAAPEVAAGEPQAPAEEEVAAAPAEEDVAAAPAEDAAAPETSAETPEVAAAPTPEAAAAPQPEADAEQPAEVEVAAAPAPEAAETAPAPEAAAEPAAVHRVVVEAVEIEGDKVFVAGYADQGRTVRVYANALLLGDARASEGGRFLVEATRPLPVGDYVIRADLLSEDGTVLARAAVPFEREEGEAIAAVAPPAGQATPEPEEEEVAAAPEAGDSAETEIEIAVAPEVVEQDVAAAPETGAPAPAETPEAAIAAGEPEAPAAPEQQIAADEAEQAEPEVEIAAAPPAADAGEPALTGPKLQRVDGAVIIRRGDNLWRISRRVYGLGVRFSTIYLANQDQISDPNRIWPGQVFSVPQETAEGEVADMEAIGEQAVSPDTESQIIR